MLFYVKRNFWLDLAATVLLGGIGLFGMDYFSLSANLNFTTVAVVYGIAGFLILTVWTFMVQQGYALFRAKRYAKQLTESLGKEYSNSSTLLAIFGGMTAAFGEELFFRGLIQGKWGIFAGAFAFGMAHFGKKEIRVVTYWSFLHGFLIGLSYSLTGNLVVPMIAHGLFDLGAITYLKSFVNRRLRVV